MHGKHACVCDCGVMILSVLENIIYLRTLKWVLLLLVFIKRTCPRLHIEEILSIILFNSDNNVVR